MQTEPASTPDTRARRADIVLAFVVAVAVMLAIGSVVEDAASLPEGAFASVNGEALPGAQLQSVLLRLGEQLDHPPGAAERAEAEGRIEKLSPRGVCTRPESAGGVGSGDLTR